MEIEPIKQTLVQQSDRLTLRHMNGHKWVSHYLITDDV